MLADTISQITIYKLSNASRRYPVAKSHQSHQGSQRGQL